MKTTRPRMYCIADVSDEIDFFEKEVKCQRKVVDIVG
jgi:hypothetical protein